MACQKEIGHEKGGRLCIQKPFLLPLIAIIVILRMVPDGDGCYSSGGTEAGDIGGRILLTRVGLMSSHQSRYD